MSATRVSLGLVGKPNAGKSTLFSAISQKEAEIGNYPFTTVRANSGIGFLEIDCPHMYLGKTCNPNYGSCVDGKRMIPVEIIDIPGLIKGASEGKGMGNQFLESLRDSMAVLLVYDASGTTSPDGNIMPSRVSDPLDDMEQIRSELYNWMVQKMRDGWDRYARRADQSGEPMELSLLRKVSFAGINHAQIKKIAGMGFPTRLETWSDGDFISFAKWVFSHLKPVIPVGNKADLLGKDERKQLTERFPESFLISAEYELALSRAISHGFLKIEDSSYRISETVNERQKQALLKIMDFFSDETITRTSSIIRSVIRDKLQMITVFPVADESHWTDKSGNILPDAYVVPKGTTASDLAFTVHSDIGEGFIRAVDCKTKRIVGRDHELRDGDVIKIIAKTS